MAAVTGDWLGDVVRAVFPEESRGPASGGAVNRT